MRHKEGIGSDPNPILALLDAAEETMIQTRMKNTGESERRCRIVVAEVRSRCQRSSEEIRERHNAFMREYARLRSDRLRT